MTCLYCSKELKGTQTKFCCKNCAQKYYNRWGKVEKSENICPYCGANCTEQYCNELHKIWHNSYLTIENNKITFKPMY